MRRRSLRLRAASSGCGRFLLRGVRWRQAEVEGWSVEDVQTFFRSLRMLEVADEIGQHVLVSKTESGCAAAH